MLRIIKNQHETALLLNDETTSSGPPSILQLDHRPRLYQDKPIRADRPITYSVVSEREDNKRAVSGSISPRHWFPLFGIFEQHDVSNTYITKDRAVLM